MDNINGEELVEKIALAMEIARMKAEKKKQKDQQNPAGTLRTKAKVAPWV